MIPMSEAQTLCPLVVFADNTIELTLDSICNLVEDELPRMNIYSNLNLDTKVSISNVGQGFKNLLYCA